MPDMEVCAECHRPIEDQYVLRVGDCSLHQECLKCASCRVPLTDSCFSKFGQFYCRSDFYRMFGPRCASCGLVFTETDKARKIGESLFHTHCFTCRDCSANLTEGDKVGCDHRGNLFCEIDYIKHSNSSEAGSDDTSQYFDMDNSSTRSGSDEMTSCSSIKREQTPEKESGDLSDDDKDGEGEIGKDGKRRGPRTTIKAKQLEVLKTCFDQNPKPTRQVREQLAKDTGLPMRVIQVWFQNKRSKQKRINQMQFITGHRFPPHMGMPFPPHPWGPPGPFGCPPGGMGGDFPPPPHMFPPNFDHPCGPAGPPQHHDPYGPYPPYSGPPTSSSSADFSSPDQNGRMSESPNHCYPSPPGQPSDFPGVEYPPPRDYPPGGGGGPAPDSCFPSPPLDFSCPSEYGAGAGEDLGIKQEFKQELPSH